MTFDHVQPGSCSRSVAGAAGRAAGRHLVCAIVGISTAFGAFTPSGADASPILADRDAQIASDGSASDTRLNITNLKPNAGDVQKSILVSFDLSEYTSAPGFSQFASVILQLGVPRTTPTAGFTQNVNRLKVDFVETQATWSEYSSGNTWTSPGGLNAADSELVATGVAPGHNTNNIAWANGGLDVTAAANAWVAAQDTTQLGFIIYYLDESDHVTAQYYSKESDEAPNPGAKLLVEVPEPATMLAPVIGAAMLTLRRRRL